MSLDDQQRPRGTGDQGQSWDPVQKRWVPQGQMPAQPQPAAGNIPTDASGNPLISGQGVGGDGRLDGGKATPGRVVVGPTNGGNSGPAWGGYAGTNVQNEDGTVTYHPELNGQAADVDRLRRFANGAAGAAGPQINYGNANGDNQLDQNDRTRQDDAISIAQAQATGQETPAQRLAKQTLAQGAQMQVAGALSHRGGALQQANALDQQQQGAGAYNARGNSQIAALRADEMAQGRNAMAGLSASQRAGDIASQGNNANQAINQGNVTNAQQDINQAGQMGYEQMGSKVNEAAASQAITQKEQAAGVASNAIANKNAQADADLNTANAVGESYKNAAKGAAGGGGGGAPSDRRIKDLSDYLGRK